MVSCWAWHLLYPPVVLTCPVEQLDSAEIMSHHLSGDLSPSMYNINRCLSLDSPHHPSLPLLTFQPTDESYLDYLWLTYPLLVLPDLITQLLIHLPHFSSSSSIFSYEIMSHHLSDDLSLDSPYHLPLPLPTFQPTDETSLDYFCLTLSSSSSAHASASAYYYLTYNYYLPPLSLFLLLAEILPSSVWFAYARTCDTLILII